VRTIAWSKRSRDDLRGLDESVKRRVIAAVTRYAETGHGDVKSLKGHVGEYRLRVGDWRVRFALDAARSEIVVLHVLHRREAYRD
jgi:mRNA interferase RelE/StbE